MEELSLRHANIIQQALDNEDGTTKWWTSEMTPELLQLLESHGLKSQGIAPKAPLGSRPDFWTLLAVADREAAEAAIRPFRVPTAPIDFKLTPIEHNSHWADYICPECGSKDIRWSDGDSVGVPVLPDGIDSYGDVDTSLMVGKCTCSQPLFFYEFGFSTVSYPDDVHVFCVPNIEQAPDKFQIFRAEAKGLSPWAVSRRWYSSSPLGKGPFTVDYHQFGPFKLDHEGELSGSNGVVRGGFEGNDKWIIGRDLFLNLAGKAMRELKSAPLLSSFEQQNG